MILAIDIGGTFIKFGLVDDDFRISNQSKVPTPSTLDDFWMTLEQYCFVSQGWSFLVLPLHAREKLIVNEVLFSRVVLFLI